MAKNLLQIELNEDESSQEWMHILATMNTCAIPTKTQFCDEDGYDIVPIRMIKVVNVPNSKQIETPATQPST